MRAVSTRVTLLTLFGLFLVPLVVAWLMYSGVIEYRPDRTRNRGMLIEPPVAAAIPETFPELELDGHWLLLYPVSLACEDRCLQDLKGLRQVLRSLGREASRVRPVVVTDASDVSGLRREVASVDPGFAVIDRGTEALLQQMRDTGEVSGTWVVDPLGNIMMHYRAGADPGDIRLDLDRLLQYGKTDQR